MARIRTIKPEFCSSADTGALSRDARLFFLQVLTEADDEGRFLWLPRRLSGVLFPHDDDVGPGQLEGWASECCRRGMLAIYCHHDVLHAQVINWAKHQRINRPTKSKLPSPSDEESILVEGAPPKDSLSPHGEGCERVHREQGTGKGNRESSLRSDLSTAQLSTDLDGTGPADLGARRAERTAAVTEDAIEAYNSILAKPNGKLSKVSNVGRKTRRKQIARMLTIASEICIDQFGDRRVTPAFWQAYFAACNADRWMRGDGPYTGDHANWTPDFEYLTRPTTVVKVFEKATQEDAA